MRTLRTVLSLVLLATAVVFVPTATDVAVAVAPPTTPYAIRTATFEAAQTNVSWGVNPNPPGYVPDAWWGQITFDKHGGSKALWCGGAPDPYAWYSSYPIETSGRVTIGASELANYYSASVSLWYKMPTRGSSDDGSFLVGWWANADPGTIDTFPYFPTSAAWTQRTFDLTADSNDANLGRAAGTVVIEFNDKTGGSESPETGKGATIDDVVISGYKYGPPRNLTVVAGTGQQSLSWAKPYRAKGTTTQEERAVTYRVWRAPELVAPYTWTELTTTRLSGTTYTDTTVVGGADYTYLVQAWDTATGTGYGEPAMVAAVSPGAPGLTLTASVDKPMVAPGTTVTYTYEARNTGSVTLYDVVVSDEWGERGGTGVLAPGDAETWTHQRVVNSAETNSVSAVARYGVSGTITAADEVSVSIADAAVEVIASVDKTTVMAGDDVLYTYVVRNAGASALSAVSVTDDHGAVGSTFPLAAGATKTLTRTATINAAVTNDVTVSGTSGGTQVTGSDSISVDVEPARVAGSDRMSTAIEISKQLFPQPFGADSRKAVIIATAFDYPDALSSSALAGALQGPLLLVQRDSLPAAVSAEISRLGAKKAYIVGGTGAVSTVVENALKAKGLTVERVAGASRYGTAVAVAKGVRSITGTTETVFVATGANFPDALAASSLAARMKAPILLSQKDTLTGDTEAYLRELKPARIVVCGGAGVVSSAVEASLGTAAYGTPEVSRNGGANRYATAELLIGWGVANGLDGGGLDGMYLATGANYPDALAGGVLGGAGDAWRPLMLTDPAALSPQVAEIVSENPTISFITMLGGTGAVSDVVAASARQLLQ